MTSASEGDAQSSLAGKVADLAQSTGRQVGTAESLTGGRISCLLGAAPDSSAWFRGSIVAYSREVKHELLQVPPGPVVSAHSAARMAANAASLLGADTVIAVTGAAGPGGQDGQNPGTVWFGLHDRGTVTTEMRIFGGTPADVVEQTAEHALKMLTYCIAAE